MHSVYIIHSLSLDRYYSGMTTNLRKRVKQHRSGRTRSVPASEDWIVVWSVTVDSSEAARALEKRIKSRGAKRFLEDQE